MFDAADRARQLRDRRHRRRLLDLLYRSRGNESAGWVTGRFLLDVFNMSSPPASRVSDDGTFIALCRDLVIKHLAEERDDRELKTQEWGLDYLSFRVTAQGVSLAEGTAPVDPDIEDERLAR